MNHHSSSSHSTQQIQPQTFDPQTPISVASLAIASNIEALRQYNNNISQQQQQQQEFGSQYLALPSLKEPSMVHEPLQQPSSEVQNMTEEIFRFISQCISYMQENDTAPQQICLLVDKLKNNVQPFHVYDLSGLSPESPVIIAKIPTTTFNNLAMGLSSNSGKPDFFSTIPSSYPIHSHQYSNQSASMAHVTSASESVTSSTSSQTHSAQRPCTVKSSPSSQHMKRDDTEEYIKGSWTEEEDRMLISLVNQHGTKKWTRIAEDLPGRIGKQCRERYMNHLDPSINKSPWTEDEDLEIIRLREEFGNQWSKIAKKLRGRTANAVKNRWNSALKRILSHHTTTSSSYTAQVKGGSFLYTKLPIVPSIIVDGNMASTCQSTSSDSSSSSGGTTFEPFNYNDMFATTSANQSLKRERDPNLSLSDRASKRPKNSLLLNLEADERMFNPFTNTYLSKSPQHTTESLSHLDNVDEDKHPVRSEGSGFANLQIDLQSLHSLDYGPRSSDSHVRLIGDTPRYWGKSSQGDPSRSLWGQSSPQSQGEEKKQ